MKDLDPPSIENAGTLNGKVLYYIIYGMLKHRFWRDDRHRQTFSWMVVGLIITRVLNPSSWTSIVEGRGENAESHLKAFMRWLRNDRINPYELYGPIIKEALVSWGENTLYLALDTSVIFKEYCLIRISVIYRGRAIPLVQKVIAHPSASVKFEEYKELLDEAVKLVPKGAEVKLLADRGFVSKEFMTYVDRELEWVYIIRLKKSNKIKRPDRKKAVRADGVKLRKGQAVLWQGVYLTDEEIGPVNVALGRPRIGRKVWYLVSNRPMDEGSFNEYGLRFDIEENFLDDKSNGFQLESSELRDAEVLTRLLMVVAVATVYLVSQGTEVVKEGKRRVVDSHWFRGMSYLKIGWAWMRRALSGVKDCVVIRCMKLIGGADPEPAQASSKTKKKKYFLIFNTEEFYPIGIS